MRDGTVLERLFKGGTNGVKSAEALLAVVEVRQELDVTHSKVTPLER